MNTGKWHQDKGASFEEFFGQQIPSHYGDPEKEYWKLRKDLALRDVSYFGKIRVSGKDRQRFLNGMLSNEVKSLEAGKGVWALSLDVKGHLQADLKVYAFPDHLLIVLQHYLVDRLISHLDKYIISEDVRLADVTNELGMLQILGPESENFLAQHSVSIPQEKYSFLQSSFNGISLQMIRLPAGFALLCAGGDSISLLDALPIDPIGMRAFDIFRIESGLPLMNVDMNETNFPQEARLDPALNFHKGCYLGQETMARIDAQGHVNKLLMGLTSQADFRNGDAIYKDEREIGKIMSATRSLLLEAPLALAYVRREFAKEGESVVFGDHRTAATVKQLPL